jgi:uncharacterized protein (DUF433 family)
MFPAMSVVVIDPEIMGGEPVFAGTRVPIKTLTDYLEGGDSIDVFLDHFPSVSREQAIAFLEEARERRCAAAERVVAAE